MQLVRRESGLGALVALVLMSGSAWAAAPVKPPHAGCSPVPKQEYNSARKQRLLRTRSGEYVRTGSVLRRHFWYCH